MAVIWSSRKNGTVPGLVDVEIWLDGSLATAQPSQVPRVLQRWTLGKKLAKGSHS